MAPALMHGVPSTAPVPARARRSGWCCRAAAHGAGGSSRASPPAHLFDLGAASGKKTTAVASLPPPLPPPGAAWQTPALAALGVAALGGAAKYILDKPSRAYGETSVGAEYDAWSSEGILEYYWARSLNLSH